VRNRAIKLHKMDSSGRRALVLAVLRDEEVEKAPKKRRFWVHDIYKKRRKEYGEYHMNTGRKW